MPNTFAQAGFLGGILLFSIVIFINCFTMLQLLKVSDQHRGIKSYSELGQRVFGNRGKLLIDACILVKQIGSCVSYLYFIATQIDFLACEYSQVCYGNSFFMVLLIIPVVIISSLDSYKYMAYLSVPSISLAILGMLMIFVYCFQQV